MLVRVSKSSWVKPNFELGCKWKSEMGSLTIKKKQINKLRSFYPLAKIVSIDDLKKTEVSSGS